MVGIHLGRCIKAIVSGHVLLHDVEIICTDISAGLSDVVAWGRIFKGLLQTDLKGIGRKAEQEAETLFWHLVTNTYIMQWSGKRPVSSNGSMWLNSIDDVEWEDVPAARTHVFAY